jgi:hypothetical protein
MTRRWIAQASASVGVQSFKPLVTAAWSGATIFFRLLFIFSKRRTFFPRLFFVFRKVSTR